MPAPDASRTSAPAEQSRAGATIVVSDDLGGRLKSPDGSVPFAVDRDRAGAEFRQWVGSRWFAPSALKKVVRADSMRGAYLPYWTFDDKTSTDYTGRRGEYYWTTETYTTTDANGNTQTNTRQVRHTRWYPASGRVARELVDLMVAAVESPDLEVLRELGPWSTADATGFEPQFLAGFDTPRYTVPAEAGFAVAKRAMADRIEEDCQQNIGGDEQQVLSMQITDSDVLFRLLLVPVWLATYAFSGKTYRRPRSTDRPARYWAVLSRSAPVTRAGTPRTQCARSAEVCAARVNSTEM